MGVREEEPVGVMGAGEPSGPEGEGGCTFPRTAHSTAIGYAVLL